MKICISKLVMCIALSLTVFGAFSSEIHVVLTGNTADMKDPKELFGLISQHLTTSSDTVVWVLNGDILPEKYTDNEIVEWKKTANQLLDQHSNLFILANQGDRDWQDSGDKGLQKLQNLEKLLSSLGHHRFQIFFNHGCPGPWTFSLATLDVVVINSQWWNHPHHKPIPSSDDCTIADTDNFIEEFEGILDEVRNKNVMILSHFPIESLGNYGGRFSVSSYLLPPLVGNALVAYRQNVGTKRDIVNEQFDQFRRKLNSVLHDYSSIVFASGHEENQTILKVEKNYFINSGGLVKTNHASKSKRAPLVSEHPGFIEVSYKPDGVVSYQNFWIDDAKIQAAQTGILFESPCLKGEAENRNTQFRPCDTINISVASKVKTISDAVKIAAGNEYASGGFKKAWFGQHYRASWTRLVEVPYLNMDTTFQGLVVAGKGGGRQTTSLKMLGENGKEYVFRSVNKDPFRALDYELRGTIVADVLKDQTSTQQPYGAMAVAPLLDKINILHASPKLYVLPDNEKLGAFKKDYAGLYGMIEERPTDKIAKKNIFGGARDIEKSFKMFEKLYHDHDNRIDRQEFARARMFDLWIGDWSKHEDNWKWAGYKDKNGEVYRPIPRDRDHAFSRWDGIIPWIADREWGMPNGENFGDKIHGLKSLMWQARHLDRFAGNQLTMADWVNAAKYIQQSVNDKDITDAVRQMPAEIYEPDGKEIERKLKVRVKDLVGYAEQYYLMLAKEVDVVGSNKKEYFLVVRNADGSVEVTVSEYDKDKKPEASRIYYHRVFYPNETKEIRLFGLLQDDIFEVKGQTEKSILVRIISGGGEDVIVDQSKVKGKKKLTLVYDRDEKTDMELGKEARKVTPIDKSLYDYNRKAFAYNTYLPIALLTYNPFVGFAVHGGVTFTRHNFSKPDFSAKHSFKASVSVKGNYDFNYSNQFREVVGRWDLVSGVGVSRPLNYNYFFGIGNDTPNDPERSSNYYRTQYNSVSAFAGLVKQFWKRCGLDFSLHYEMDEGIKRSDSYLSDHPDVFGVDRLHLVFVQGIANLDFRDRATLPERGFLFRVTQQVGHISNAKENIASISELELEQYFSTYHKNPLTFGLRLGGGHAFGQLPFYKLFSLGQLNDLRGYKRNRFTGNSKAFLNTELRYQITQTKNTFIPLKIGIRAFYDIGQVWADGEINDAKYWHKGYGGGFYITPFREQFAFNVSAGSSREEPLLLMISVGSFFR